MNTQQDNLNLISERAEQLSFMLESSPDQTSRLVLNSIDSGRAQSRKRLETMHPANRFRLMFGLTPLPEEPRL